MWVIAGEHSGDEHAARMVRELLAGRPDLQVCALGGPRLAAAGAQLLRDLTKGSAMGFAVIAKLAHYRKLIATIVDWVGHHRPRAVCFVDSSGLNLRIAAGLFDRGYSAKAGGPTRLLYYISPQIWAWHRERIHTLARVVDLMLVIFPFEVGLYRAKKVDVVHVGHPLFDVMKIDQTKEEVFRDFNLDPARPLITIVPGSRKREVQDFLRIMLQGARRYWEAHPETQFAVVRASTIEPKLIDDILAAELAHILQVGDAGEGAAVAQPPTLAGEERQRAVADAGGGFEAVELGLLGALFRAGVGYGLRALHRPGAAQILAADAVVVADQQLARLAVVLEILGHGTDRGELEDLVAGADRRAPLDHDVRPDPRAGPEAHLGADDRVGADGHVGGEHGARRDDRRRMDLRAAHDAARPLASCGRCIAR